MPLQSLPRPSCRPRGGVSKVELFPALSWAGTDSPAPVRWEFAEDRARYSETAAGADTTPRLVKRTLEMEFPLTPAATAALDGAAAIAAAEGLVARITLASGETVMAGHSEKFGVDYPLRILSRSVCSERSPGELPVAGVVLETYDVI